MNNKTYIAGRIAWLEWLEGIGREKNTAPFPEKYPCVAVKITQTMAGITMSLSLAEALGIKDEFKAFEFPLQCDLVETSIEYVYLDDFLPF